MTIMKHNNDEDEAMESPRKRSRSPRSRHNNNNNRSTNNDPPSSSTDHHHTSSSNYTGGIVNVSDKSRSKSLLRERDAKIAALEKEVLSLRNQISTLSAEHAVKHSGAQRGNGSQRKMNRQLTPYGNTVRVSVSKCSAKRRQLLAERARMGRNASISTQKILNALPDTQMDSQQALIDRIQDMFRSPHEHVSYLKSEQFAKDVLKLNKKVRTILEDEPRCVFLQSPAYVFGDIHGNLEDLHFFSDNVWNLGMSLTAGNFVFLGDYVDRGMSCLEVVSYLLAMKLMLPHKVFLLRGNHETRDVNGWEEHYGARSFIYQCRERFGEEVGYKVWESTNQTFDRLPLAAVVDQDIFCVHGGIPRPISDSSVEGGRIKDILNVSKVAGINPPYEHEDDNYQQVASDCIWSDPASEEQEQYSVDKRTGYGDSLRGGGAICFGHKAVTHFLQQQGFSYIMRAHEAHAEGVAVSKGARVFTVFSTSKDHNQGNNAMAGCILIDFEKMQVINRSPAYRNQYVHRRDSVSIAMLSEAEVAERVQLGLITTDPREEEFEQEEWEEFEEEDDDEELDRTNDSSFDEDDEYVIDDRRKSSVDPCGTRASPEGCTHDSHDYFMEGSDMPAQKIDFSGAGQAADSTSRRSKKRGAFSTIREEDDDDDEESTVNGDDDMEPFDDDENHYYGASSSTGMSPGMRRVGI